MTDMRAKMRVGAVLPCGMDGNKVTQEKVYFHAVAASQYPNDGADENNTFAKYTPSAELNILIANPSLIGGFSVGDTFYVDFMPVE